MTHSLTEIHVPYGPTEVFLTIEPDELLYVKDADARSWVGRIAGGRSTPPMPGDPDAKVFVDFRLALDRGVLTSALSSIIGGRTRGRSAHIFVLSPRSALGYLQQLIGPDLIASYAMPTAEGPIIILSKATCHAFLDLLGSLGPFAYPSGGPELIEALDQHLSGNDEKAIALLLDPLKELGKKVSLALTEKSYAEANLLECRGADEIAELCAAITPPPLEEIPQSATAAIGSLGGEPNDSVPSAGIPYLLSARSGWATEVMGFVAIWDHSLVDLPMFASVNMRQGELLNNLKTRFDWHDLVLYMIRGSDVSERTRVVTSMPPGLVQKALGWRVVGAASDLVKSLKRSVRGEFRLAVLRDISMSSPPSASKPREA